MPELPEVETMRRGILEAQGSQIVDMEKIRCHCKSIEISPPVSQFRRRISGKSITEITRVGKRVVLVLDSDDRIVLEPRMTGLILVVDPPTHEHLRWKLELSNGPFEEILYWDRRGLGNVRLFSEKEFHEQFGPKKLGPDALDISADLFQQQLGKTQREIKPALLDQRAVAGIGNLYASEILHVAGIHPQRQCARMTKTQWRALTEATHMVLEEAIRYEGSTLSDGTYRNALNKQGSYQNEHRVYNRANEKCSRCKNATIKKIVQTQRSTFFCEKCQTKSGALI